VSESTDPSPYKTIAALEARYAGLPPGGINEANTRLQFINEMLVGVLGWSIEHLNPEEYLRTLEKQRKNWIDYHVQHGDAIRLVVEAKRAGASFSLPTNKKPRTIPLVQLRQNHGDALRDAIDQAIKYAVNAGTYSFVVTNGWQWIASLAFAQNVPAEKIEAVVFYDLADIRANLQDFIDVLSPDGIASQTLMQAATSGGSAAPTFAKRANDVLRPAPASSDKNYLSQPLRVLMRMCFGDLTDEEHAAMLEDCYVTNEATDVYMTRLEAFVGSTLPDSLSGAEKLTRDAAEHRSIALGNRRVGLSLVVGKAGSGKSTYLAVTKARLAKKFKDGKIALLHVDLQPMKQLLAESFDHDRMVDDVCKELLDAASKACPALDPYEHELLREIFAGEIEKVRKTIHKDRRYTDEAEQKIGQLIEKHLETPWQHLKAYLGFLDKRDIAATVLLDNVDRGSPEFERQVFQLAQNLALNTNAAVVTTLRDTTYQHGRIGPNAFLDTTRYSVFSVSPPPFREVAAKRFDYVRKQFRDDPALSKRFIRSLPGVQVDRVIDFGNILAELVLGENREIQECIQALAGTNIRRALELLEDFASSPNTDLNYLFGLYERGRKSGREVGPTLDVFLRPIMWTDQLRYSEQTTSKVMNLFQVTGSRLTSHFTAVRILQLLSWQSKQARESADMQFSHVIDRLAAIGQGRTEVRSVAEHLGKFGLVNSLSKPEAPWEEKDSLRLGAAGSYYLERLLHSREYIFNVVDDTIIYDAGVHDTLIHLQHDREREWPARRADKARTFLLYLARREIAELTRMGAPKARPPWLVPVAELLGVEFFGQDFKKDVRGIPHKG
jgi:hypothetical protein